MLELLDRDVWLYKDLTKKNEYTALLGMWKQVHLTQIKWFQAKVTNHLYMCTLFPQITSVVLQVQVNIQVMFDVHV